MAVPILKAKPSTLPKQYVVELTLTSGAKHRLTFKFEVPTGPDGTIDLSQMKDFDPQAQAVGNVVNMLAMAHSDPVIFADRQAQLAQQPGRDRQRQPVTVGVDNGTLIVWRHVESFLFLGELADVTAADAAAKAAAAAAAVKPKPFDFSRLDFSRPATP